MRQGARKPNPGSPGTGGRTPANVEDSVGYEFRRAMFSASGPKGETLNPRNIRRILGSPATRRRGPRTRPAGGRTRYQA